MHSDMPPQWERGVWLISYLTILHQIQGILGPLRIARQYRITDITIANPTHPDFKCRLERVFVHLFNRIITLILISSGFKRSSKQNTLSRKSACRKRFLESRQKSDVHPNWAAQCHGGGINRFPTFTKFVVLFNSVYSCSEVYSAPDRVGLFWLKTDNDRMWLSKCLFVPRNAQGFNNPF